VRSAALIAALTQGRSILQRRQGRTSRKTAKTCSRGIGVRFLHPDAGVALCRQSRYDVGRCQRLGIHAQAARQVQPLYDYFLNIAREEGLKIEETAPDNEAIQKCVLTGFSDQLARRLDSGTLRCQLVHGRRGVLARESVVQRSPLIVAAEVHEIEGKDRELNVLLTLATAVKAEWLKEISRRISRNRCRSASTRSRNALSPRGRCSFATW